MEIRRSFGVRGIVAGLLSAPALALAAPIELDTLYDPFFGNHTKAEGYLEFINPTEHPGLVGLSFPATPPGVIQTEEYTGWTDSSGRDHIEVGDSDTTAGDRADFDWVQENRACETGGPCNNAPQAVNHPGLVGAMGWTIGSPDVSPHVDPGTGRPHDDGPGGGPTHSDEQTPPGPLPHLENVAYTRDSFNAVDVFSIISLDQDDGVDLGIESTLRAAALDYEIAFGNSITGFSTAGVLSVIWLPGWTAATFVDNYVARWVPLVAGSYDLVAIEPTGIGDNRTEIDAIKALFLPEPGVLGLMALGILGLSLTRRRAA